MEYTVRDLIQSLETCDPDAPVYVYAHCYCLPLRSVSLAKDRPLVEVPTAAVILEDTSE